MAALFQTMLMRLALCGLAASLVLLLLRSRLVRDTFARLLSIWCSLTVFGRFAVCSFLLIGILIGGDKTNSVPPNMNSPLPQMQQGGVFLTGFTGLTGLSGAMLHTPSSLNPVNLVNPVQKPSRDDPRYLSRIHKLVPFLKYDSFMAIAKPGKAIH